MILGNGRPLRFLGLVTGGWVALRVGLAWDGADPLPQAVRGVLPLPVRASAAATPVAPIRLRVETALRALTAPAYIASVRPIAAPVPVIGGDLVDSRFALIAPLRVGEGVGSNASPTVGFAQPLGEATPVPPAGTRAPSRMSVSSWMIARGGMGIGATPLSPQLGGTQGGVRVDYALAGGFAATGRIAAPAAGAGREVSIGIAWRPAGVPVRVVAEQRLALDGGRSGPALGISSGVSDLPLPAGFRLDGYGQAGVIARDGMEQYVDGSVRAARPLTDLAGVAIDVGAGAWGGAQRGVARVDVGPSIGAKVPMAGTSVRVSIDWRHRVAGNARPGSGLALTLGTDF